MDYNSNEVKVGAMLVIALVLLMVFMIAVFGINWGKQHKEYVTYLENVPGIVEGTLVKFGGMDVGHVTKVNLPENIDSDSKIGLRLEVDEKTPVRVNSYAFVTSIGIMANNHIEISSGTLDADLLPAGSVLPSREVLSFSQMSEPLGEVSEQLKILLDRVSELFDEKNRAHLTSMLESMEKIMSQGGDQFIGLMENLDQLTANLAQVSNELNQLMEGNRETLAQTLSHLEKTTKETSELISEMRGTLANFENSMDSNSRNLVEIMDNFQYTSQNLEEFTRAVKERPWLLVRKAAPPQRKDSN